MDDSKMKKNDSSLKDKGGFFILTAVLLVLLCALLYPVFAPENVQFSNDGPYGVISSDTWKLPQTFLGQWNDLNWLGNEDVAAPPNVTNLIRLLLGTLGFAKFDAFLTTLFAGLCGGLFFRVIGGNWWVCALGGLAAAFNSNNFSNACWGLGSRPLCFGGAMLALSMIATKFRGRYSWLKVALAGVGAGLAIMEGYDLGAILCIYIALYAAFVTFFDTEAYPEGERYSSPGNRALLAVIRVMVIAAVTALTASYSLFSLSETQVKDVGIFDQQAESQRWNFSTQWSFPKQETLRLIIPGLKGYRMDSPDGKNYWGSVGETPGYEPGGAGMARFSGSGEYAGLLVVLIASWAVASIFRKKDNPFNQNEIRHLKFWSIVALCSLLLAFGRYAPFYQLVYITPVIGMFRNPIKYLVPFHISILILFGYALVGFCRAYLNDISLNSNRESKETWGTSLAIGWRKLTSFDKAWVWGVLIWIGVSLLGLLIFLSAETSVVAYLQKTGFSIQESESIFAASMWEIMIYLALLMIGLILVTFILGKRLKPQRATILCWVILVICMLDFYRANKPWTVFYNYQTRLQKDDMIEYLISQPKTERVSIVPGKDEYSQALMQLYSVEWMQHEFPHYNIHTLQSWMEPRKGTDKIIFEGMFSTNMLRYWELTGVKHLISAKGYAEALNTSLDSEKKRFSEEFIFTMNPVEAPRHLLAKQDQEGPFSIIRFEGAIPRLALYQNWEVVPTDNEVFTRLTDPEFDPTQTVLISQDSIPEGDSGICTNEPAPFVQLDYKSYSPLKFTVDIKGVTRESLLLINDRYNVKWKAFVDGKPAEIVRCNYIARGIRLSPGDHQLEMRFEQNTFFFFVSLVMMVIGLPALFILLRRNPFKLAKKA